MVDYYTSTGIFLYKIKWLDVGILKIAVNELTTGKANTFI